MWKCPSCENEIECLDYSTATREWGSCTLFSANNNGEITTETKNFEQSNNEWSGDIEYFCPECQEEINLSNLLLVKTEQKDKDEEKKEESKELEEEKFNIIEPKIKLQTEDKNHMDHCNSTIICKSCNYFFVSSTEKYGDTKEFVDCPKCETPNNEDEYRKLIKDGFFEKKKIKKLRH